MKPNRAMPAEGMRNRLDQLSGKLVKSLRLLVGKRTNHRRENISSTGILATATENWSPAPTTLIRQSLFLF